MSSHVPFLAVRPDDQFSTEVKRTARTSITKSSSASTNAIAPAQPMDSPPPLTSAPRTYAASRIPSVIRFPLLVILSFALATTLHTLAAGVHGLSLATASRSLQEPWQIGTLLGWKVLELLVAWVAGYDCTYSHILARHNCALLTKRHRRRHRRSDPAHQSAILLLAALLLCHFFHSNRSEPHLRHHRGGASIRASPTVIPGA